MESPVIATLIKMMENLPETEQNSDTHPKIHTIQMEMLRKASPARKLELLGQMNLMVKTLALSGLRSRYPDDPPELLRRRLADLILGPELALKVYGPYPE